MNFTANSGPSLLCADEEGKLMVHLLQVMSGWKREGYRNERLGAERNSADFAAPCRTVLQKTTPNALNVISFHRGMIGCQADLIELSRDRTLVTLAGIDGQAPGGKLTNDTYIAQNGQLEIQAKISLSSEDRQDSVQPGEEYKIYLPGENDDAISWAVLNCHEYTHVDLITELLRNKIELVVVVTHNTATRLYWEYAIADIHRLFCYVVIINIGELGGSGIFAPFRRIGFQKNAEIGAAGQLFETRGRAEIDAKFELDIRELRRLRTTFAEKGFEADAVAKEGIGPFTAVMPSERFLRTCPERTPGAPRVDCIKRIPTSWQAGTIRVAIAQLNSMTIPEYVDSKYRIRNHPNCEQFLERLDSHLTDLARRCKLLEKTPSDAHLDVLLLPEVFVPRSYLGKLQALSDDLGSTIICGIDYPGEDEESNANECSVLRPGMEAVTYRKITRSQYDAWRTYKKPVERMKLNRGNELYRFTNELGQGFGVLICYDFSHFDLVHQLNLKDRDEPLDALFIVAHNPFGNLYRSCCIADAHRFYQYVVMCNVSEFGGSGVFAPQRTPGARQTILDIGKGTEAIALAELDIAGLHNARAKDDNLLHEADFIRKPGVFQNRKTHNSV